MTYIPFENIYKKIQKSLNIYRVSLIIRIITSYGEHIPSRFFIHSTEHTFIAQIPQVYSKLRWVSHLWAFIASRNVACCLADKDIEVETRGKRSTLSSCLNTIQMSTDRPLITQKPRPNHKHTFNLCYHQVDVSLCLINGHCTLLF